MIIKYGNIILHSTYFLIVIKRLTNDKSIKRNVINEKVMSVTLIK